MRVGFNARLLASDDPRGWNRYTVNLIRELPAFGVEPVLYSDRPIHSDHLASWGDGGYVERVGRVRPYGLWEQSWLPAACRRDGVEVLHAPANFGLPWVAPCPCVLTLHDAIDRAYYAPLQGYRQRLGPRALRSRLAHAVARRRADRVITVSAHARDDLIRWFGLPPGRVEVIPEAAGPAFHGAVSGQERQRTRSRYALTRPYVFYVGGLEGRKNVPFLLRAFAESGVGEGADLVLAGGDETTREALASRADGLGLAGCLRVLGRVADGDLPALYAESMAFVYPSEYEGFGLQLCEAMAVGCPVLAAEASCLPEVLGDGGDTFPLSSTAPLSGMLRRVVRDPAYRADLSRRARLRSASYSWRATAEATARVYQELADRSRETPALRVRV